MTNAVSSPLRRFMVPLSAVLLSGLVSVTACTTAGHKVTQSSNGDGVPRLPALGDTEATTQRNLGKWLWKNADNTQAPNIYDIPYKGGNVDLQLTFSQTADGEKRVNGIIFRKVTDSPLRAHEIMTRYIPNDRVRTSAGVIGGNIAQIYGKQSSDDITNFFISTTAAKMEQSWGVKPCQASSSQRGLLVTEVTKTDAGDDDEVDVFDAALSYCAKSLDA